jgi:hypothetical protein
MSTICQLHELSTTYFGQLTPIAFSTSTCFFGGSGDFFALNPEGGHRTHMPYEHGLRIMAWRGRPPARPGPPGLLADLLLQKIGSFACETRSESR